MAIIRKNIGDIVTTVRASTGTYFDIAGVMQNAAANLPRIDYDPVTHVCKGLLVEPAATNLFLNSEVPVTQSRAVTAQVYTISIYGSGTISLSGAATATLTGSGASNNRTTFTFTPTVGTLNMTVSGSGIKAQLETGAVATSYIQTAASTVTRAVDQISVAGDNFSSVFNTTEGTIYVEYIPKATAASGQILAGVGLAGAFGTGAYASRTPSTGVISISPNSGSALGNIGASSANVISKLAWAWATSSRSAVLNGAVVRTDTNATPAGLNRFSIGCSYWDLGSQINGHILRFKYYPEKLSNAQLQALTA